MYSRGRLGEFFFFLFFFLGGGGVARVTFKYSTKMQRFFRSPSLLSFGVPQKGYGVTKVLLIVYISEVASQV